MKKVEFFKHSLSDDEIQTAVKTMQSVFLTTGRATAEFEKSFSSYTGLPYVVGLNSCTGALHLALVALGIGEGDEVITCPMTFIATATAIMHTGARPVLVDCEKDTGLIDPKLIEAAITPKTKAIIPIHLYGTMADMQAISAIAQKHNLKIVEDAAHCIEGERDGIRPGQLSDAVCYSFYATKNITCGEGGALGTQCGNIAEKIKILRTHGMSRDAADRYTESYKHWDMVELGWKYNPSDILSSLLISQIPKIDNHLSKRKKLAEEYTRLLGDINGLDLPVIKGKSAFHLFTVWVDPSSRDEILCHLQNENIGVAVNYRSIHTLTYFIDKFGFTRNDFPNSALIGESTLSLPLYPLMPLSDCHKVCSAIKNLLL